MKIKPLKGQGFKEIEVTTKDWNLPTRRKINKLIANSIDENNQDTLFDACCEILSIATTMKDDEIFNLSTEEIQAIGLGLVGEINKKK